QNSGATAFSSASQSATIVVNTPASLSSQLSVSPQTVDLNQPGYPVKTLTNSGDATANNVVPSAIAQFGTGGFALVSPAAQVPVTLVKNASASFYWTY